MDRTAPRYPYLKFYAALLSLAGAATVIIAIVLVVTYYRGDSGFDGRVVLFGVIVLVDIALAAFALAAFLLAIRDIAMNTWYARIWLQWGFTRLDKAAATSIARTPESAVFLRR